MTPGDAEKIQNEIYRKMPAEKKIKIAGQLFLFGKKLASLRKQRIYASRETSLQNSRNLRKT
jgi:hypothetical protein